MATYLYRDKLTSREILPAVGAGVGVGLGVAYLVQLLLRRRTLPSGTGRGATLRDRSR